MNGDYLIVTDNVRKTAEEVFEWAYANRKLINGLTWTNYSYYMIRGTDAKIYVRSVDRPESIDGLRIRRIYFATPFIKPSVLDSFLDAVHIKQYDCVLHCFMKHICEDLEQDKLKTAINNKYGVHSGRYPWHIQKQLLDACKLQKDVEEMTKYQTLFNPVTAGVLQDIDYRLRKHTTCGLIDTKEDNKIQKDIEETAQYQLLFNPVTAGMLQDIDHRLRNLAAFKLIDTKEDNKMQNYSKMIKDVIFNDPATIIMWKDGTKTVVRNSDDTPYDPEKGFAMAIAKKALGNEGNYYDIFKKYVPTIPIPKDLYTTEDEDVKARIGTIATRMAMDVESTGKKWTGLTRDDWKKVAKQAKREIKLKREFGQYMTPPEDPDEGGES